MEAVTILPETKKENHITEVIENVKVSEGVWHITVKAPKLAQAAKPGQFVQVLVEGAGLLLRRPLGIAGADAEQGTVELFYRVLGKGTAKLTGYRAGDSLSILGPLGHGFDTSAGNVLIVGGGMGLAPTKFLAERLEHCEALLGGRNAGELFWTKYYELATEAMHITTDDGSMGTKGFTVAVLPELLATGKYDRVAVCGPEIMMKKTFEICREQGVPCEVSLEKRMACGLGACLSCNIDSTDGRRLHVCQDGPVFRGEEVFA